MILIPRRKQRKPTFVQQITVRSRAQQATVAPKQPTPKTVSRRLLRDLFGDSRQQQQQALGTAFEADVEQVEKQNLMVATAGLGLAIGSAVVPVFYLPSAACSLYAFRGMFRESYRIYKEEQRIDYRVVWALTIPVALASGYIVAASFGGVFGLLNFFLVAKTENRSQQHIADLFGGQIRYVWLQVDGTEVKVPFEKVQEGDTVVVHAGQLIPVDGTISAGMATIDQHMLTGESQPVEMDVGDSVLASTVLLSGRIEIEVTKAGDATVAAQIMQMLSQTSDFKRTLESRTDRFLNQITIPILGLSALALPLTGASGAVAVLWYYPGARMMMFGPMSMLSYLQVAAQRSILVKDGRALETLEQIDTVVFDKTGTLTLEQPTVGRVFCYNGLTESELLRYTAAAEARQSHPIARAILQSAADRMLDLPPLDDVHYKVGYGLEVKIEGHTVHVGSIRFLQMEGITVPSTVTALQTEVHELGHSLILVALNGELSGAIELEPTIRPEARGVITALHARGIETVIISGDNDAPTRRLAAQLDIDRYFAEVLPEDKANHVAQLQAEGHKVCFVGDGINDSIALKTADVAVSLRGATTIATDVAEIVFMNGTLQQLPALFELADEFSDNMRVNVLASLLPGLVGIAGTFMFGWGMGLCVLLMQVSTPVGIYNALKPMLEAYGNEASSVN